MLFSLIRWVFRPAVLIVVSVALVGTAVLILVRPESGALQPQRPPLPRGVHEIAWIYPATGTTTWERFVTAVKRSSVQLQQRYPGLRVDDLSKPATVSRTGVPEVVMWWPHRGGTRRLVFRWYKLTSDWSPQAWVRELLARRPYPLAIIGGNNSNLARELAILLELLGAHLPQAQRPLLLLTTGTADRVPRPDWMPAPAGTDPDEARYVELGQIYPGRTYRFCFTNRQMATAVTQFLWRRLDLRPDADPPYLVQWTDDLYSEDLCVGYSRRVLDRRFMDTLLQEWGFVSGCLGLGLPPATLAGWGTSAFRHEAGSYTLRIDTSVGSFDAANPYEVRNVQFLLRSFPTEERTAAVPVQVVTPAGEDGSTRVTWRTKMVPVRLLVVTGQSGPSRRFLRELARSSPDLVRRFVVAVGDAIPFNTIYRDRMVTWPIQDLPFTLVLFSHRNPIDPNADFRPLGSTPGPRRRSAAVAASGTEDLLLYSDIVEAVVLAFAGPGSETNVEDAAGLAAGLDALHLDGNRLGRESRGRPLFTLNPHYKGMRNSFTGEHVICLQPHFEGRRVKPEATIEVWARVPGINPEHPAWKRIGELLVSYDEFKAHEVRSHGD
jgi:hypothetical protein